jgi:hypothetical protein
MMVYQIKCDCEQIAEHETEKELSNGFIFAFQCEHCGRIIQAVTKGTSRYKRDKSQTLQAAIFEVFIEQDLPLTVRQMYYALTVKGAIPKTEAGYRQTCYALAKMRKEGAIPYRWLADNTRWRRKPQTYHGLGAALERMQESYRRDLWAEQSSHVEIWVEKDALAGVMYQVTSKYDVPLFVARGYGSLSFIYDAAEEIKEIGKPTYIYHFGDFDPSGVNAAYKIQEGLQEHGAIAFFERVAITEEQIDRLQLPTRETKAKDPRAKAWGDKPSVELDALPAKELRRLVADCIEQHIDRHELERAQVIESQERETLAAIRENFVLAQNLEEVILWHTAKQKPKAGNHAERKG